MKFDHVKSVGEFFFRRIVCDESVTGYYHVFNLLRSLLCAVFTRCGTERGFYADNLHFANCAGFLNDKPAHFSFLKFQVRQANPALLKQRINFSVHACIVLAYIKRMFL